MRIKVTMCAASRFWIFDGAKQLHKYGMLHQLITQYPKYKTKQWGIPDELVSSFLLSGILNISIYRFFHGLGLSLRSKLIESMHKQFSLKVSRHFPLDTDILYGLSSFMLEAIQRSKSERIISVIDHGSLHEKVEKRILSEECEKFGFTPFGNWQYDWLLSREDEEFALADCIMTSSTLARNTLVEQGVPLSKIYLNRFGTDLSMFYPGEKKDDIFRLIFCGGIVPRKGVHYLVQAFSELNIQNSELWLIGTPPTDRRLQAILHNYWNDNIIMKGTFPQSELRRIFCQGSVFVHPSLADGWGLVVLQAMACGLPVIVTDMTGAAEAVTDGKNGFIINAQSVDKLKEKILYLYENSSLCTDMGKYAIETARDEYSWDAYGKRLRDILSNVYRTSNE